MHRLLIILPILAALAAAGWYFTRPQPLTVAVEPAQRGLVESTVANTRAGTLKACRRARLAPPGGGQVSRLEVREGDGVQAGQVLLQLWNDDLRAQLRLAQAQLSTSGSRAEEACLTADMAQRDYKRLQPLRERGLVSAERLDQAHTEALARAAACRAANAARETAQAQVAVAEAALERTLLRAPFTGVVAEVTGEVGEFVTPSPPGIPTPPAVDLIDTRCLFVSAPIDEVDAPAVKVGQAARITLDAFPRRVFEGRVRRIAPYVLDLEKQARTVEVEVEFTDPVAKDALLPGYSADIEVILDARPDALRVPTEALIDGQAVLVVADGVLARREVAVGLANWTWTEITDGVEPGQPVVVSLDRPGVEAGRAAVAEP